ncbi:hypothetical protein GH740_11445 [Microbacterium sp. SYP-A9085]|uniref:hypothetical protein n=1 Tax=Microbacterium sp. SYP-A9085 TaxID=2664454 RepID=UPI00129B0E70|nr:hypothetical protein [Microbacterium sp. SYP-A9085]MRH29918.1 hypothetical protein [Microbacterium sp. SYP-A9085]
MQLGTRWAAGAEPPARLTPEFVAQLRSVEADLPPTERGAARWTLTWLEGRPVAELDVGIIVTVDHAGAVVVRHDDEDGFA